VTLGLKKIFAVAEILTAIIRERLKAAAQINFMPSFRLHMMF